MPELISFGIAGILFIASWFALRRAIQDAHKDAIFDVRDAVRDRLARLNKLGASGYPVLRDTINRSIRFIEVADHTRVWKFTKRIEERPELEEALAKRINETFLFDDADVMRLGKWSRRKCSRVVQGYLFSSSLCTILFFHFAVLPYFLVRALIYAIQKHASKRFSELWATAQKMKRVFEDEKMPMERAELVSQMPTSVKTTSTPTLVTACP